MPSSREEKLIQEYSTEIQRLYQERSIIHYLTTVKRELNSEAPDFLKIGRRFIIPRTFFEEGHHIIVHPFADFIELSEYQYIIDTLKKEFYTFNEASTHDIKSNDLPNKKFLDDAINDIRDFTEPNYMIVPIAFYLHFYQLSRDTKKPCINFDSGTAYYEYERKRLRILWSNKFIRLNEIIIGNSRDSLWLFKSANGDERLTVKIDFNDTSADPTLLVQTVFRFQSPKHGKVNILRFSESLLISNDEKESKS